MSCTRPLLPTARGPLSASVIDLLAGERPNHHFERSLAAVVDPLVDGDLHLALWCCYEMHHHGFGAVDDALEWDPTLLGLRSLLEAAFERALREEHRGHGLPSDPLAALPEICAWDGPPLSSTLAETGTLSRLREFAIHRSAYQLKEADGHTFAIPRLSGPGRSAMIEIQADEYGWGRPGESHNELFAAAMRDLGLSDSFGFYIDRLPGSTLATDNLVELFALHRRMRGSLVGHLALFEMTSVGPMSRYSSAARRLGGLPAVERFYDVHVEADEHHGRIAIEAMVSGLLADEPDLADDVVFGAAALARVEARFAAHLLGRWEHGRASLLADSAADLLVTEAMAV